MSSKSKKWILTGITICVSVVISIIAVQPLAQNRSSESITPKSSIKLPEPAAPKPSIHLTAISNAPGNGSLREVTSSADFKGRLVYGDFAPLSTPAGPEWTPFLKQGSTGGLPHPQSISAFRVDGINSKAFDPQFSPDGKTVMFKVGDVGNRYDTFQLCFWDRTTNQVQVGPKDINYRLVYWSPNSRYVAYILGGDIEGHDSPEHQLQLHIYDIKTHQSRFIARDSYVKKMAWTPQNELLYNVKSSQPGSGLERAYEADLYTASVNKGDSRLLIKNAFNPLPSPDGKKVVFFAWPESEEAEKNTDKAKPRVQAQLGLYSYDLNTQKRTLLRSPFSYRKFIGMLWVPDNQRLLLFQKLGESPSARAQVTVIDTTDSISKTLFTITANDFQAIGSRVETQPQFQPLTVSADGEMVLIEVSEIVDRDMPLLIEEKSIRAVSLSSGGVTTIVKVRTSLGIDWFDETSVISE